MIDIDELRACEILVFEKIYILLAFGNVLHSHTKFGFILLQLFVIELDYLFANKSAANHFCIMHPKSHSFFHLVFLRIISRVSE